jgi:hypothetical protein
MATKKNDAKAPTTPTITLPKALAAADLNKAIDALCKSAQGMQAKVQEVGVQALMHLKAHNDVGPVNRLYVGLPKGMRKQALGSWLLAHGALEVNTTADTKKVMPLKFSKTKKTNPEAAQADPWFEHLPEKAIDEVFDLQRAIHGLLVRAKGKTIQLHGKVMTADHATDTLKALAAMAGEDYKPEVKQPDSPPAEQEGEGAVAQGEPATTA